MLAILYVNSVKMSHSDQTNPDILVESSRARCGFKVAVPRPRRGNSMGCRRTNPAVGERLLGIGA